MNINALLKYFRHKTKATSSTFIIIPTGKVAKIKTEVGGSRYHTLQRLKDDWLNSRGYPVQVVRQPTK